MRKSFFSTFDYHPAQSSLSLGEHYQAAIEQAKLAEQLGFEAIWLGEHHFFHNVGSVPNPAVLLAAIAQHTHRIRQGSAVAVLPLRGAALTAENYAMIDVLSNGRLNMGVGTGQVELEYQSMGVDFDNRRRSFEDNLSQLIHYWQQLDCNKPEALNLIPKQSPPPVYIATKSPDGAYTAAKQGHSILTIVSPMEENLHALTEVLDAFNQGKSQSYRPDSNTEAVVTLFAYASDSKVQAIDELSQVIGNFIPPLKEDSDIKAKIESMMHRNTALFGDAKHIGQQLQTLQQLGVKHINCLANFGGMQPNQVARNLEILAKA